MGMVGVGSKRAPQLGEYLVNYGGKGTKRGFLKRKENKPNGRREGEMRRRKEGRAKQGERRERERHGRKRPEKMVKRRLSKP